MCHPDLDYERLYEDAGERDELPDWANEAPESEKPLAPSVADD